MKYGLFVVNKTRNIGDDIQAYATKRFLPKIDYYIDRDHADEFLPNENEYVASIINGWYLQYTLNWPISPYIYPLPVSIHLTNKDWFWDTKDKAYHLQGYGLEYLKSISPIGCRDSHTKKLLDSLNVKNEYTGCMTLTIQKFKNVKKKKYICAVDVSNAVVEAIKKMTNLEVKVITHTVPESYYELSWEERMKNVEDLLKLYQGATAVVSYRLHCALPCLALGTKVILLHEEYRNDRFGDFLKYMETCTEEELVKGLVKYDFEKLPQRSQEWKTLKANLEKKCYDFIDKCEKKPPIYDKNNITIDLYKKYVIDKSNWLKQCAVESYSRYQDQSSETARIKNELQKANSELQAIKNSRTWKLRCKLKKIIKRK